MGTESLALLRTAAPLYRDVAASLERAIREGAWKAGEQISFESLERYFRYATLPGSAPLVPHNRVLDQAEVSADAEVAAAFGITPGVPVAWLRRLRCNGEEPFLLVDSYFPMPVWQVVKGADFTHHPLYDLFKNSYGQFVIAADEFLRADLASPADAALLGIRRRAGDPHRTYRPQLRGPADRVPPCDRARRPLPPSRSTALTTFEETRS